MSTHPPNPAGVAVEPDPEVMAPLVASCPAVAGLHSGRFGEVATYLPGRRVRGVRVTAKGVEIHVVGRYPFTVAEIAAQTRAAVAPIAGGSPVDIVVGDLALPGDPDPDAPTVWDLPRTTAADSPTPASSTPGSGPAAPVFPPPTGEPHPVPASSPAHRLDSKESAR